MFLSVHPTTALKGALGLPASKSYSIRAFLIAACGGRSVIIHPSECDDAKVAVRAARALGAKVIRTNGSAGQVWCVRASSKGPRVHRIHVGESGTVLRFLLPMVSFFGKRITMTGEGTLNGRPNVFLTKTLRNMGVDIRGTGPNEGIPLTVKGGALRGGRVTMEGTLSSQFISALLITCPRLSVDTYLTLTGKRLVSSDYITMTRQVLNASGIDIAVHGSRRLHIRGGQVFQGLKKFEVPSDYGLAAFLMAAALLTDSDVRLTGNLDDDWVQADGHIVGFLRDMGAQFRKTRQWIRLKGPCRLKGGCFSLKDCPDLVPIMAVLALFAEGKTRLVDIAHARAKESDRISDLRAELLKIGAKIIEKKDEMVIHPQTSYKQGCLLDPHRDHRLAMAFSVLGLKIGVIIKDIECVSKSYPDFVRDLKSLGADLRMSRVA